MSTFHVKNFGCRATQADGAALALQFESRGLVPATAESAAIVLLNTCTVTRSADQDARATIRRLQRENPSAKIFVTGCYAQRAPREIAALPGVTAVIGNSHKHQLADIVLPGSSPHETASRTNSFVPLSMLAAESSPQPRLFVSDIFAHTQLLAAPVFESATSAASDRTRPNLKVQDGCGNRCSFCIIPSVRGLSRSLPLSDVILQIHALVDAGYRELVISGINLGRWGRDLKGESALPMPASAPAFPNRKTNFENLLRSILNETDLQKLRISSVEPMDWTRDLISLVASSPRIARHAHVPLQSGSDAVLRRMHRKYRPWHYREKIQQIHAAMPTAAIGADVMVGFPGETDAEFDDTRSLIENLPFTYLHVFTYSPRPGTPAAAMPNQVPVHIARERNKILRDLATEKKQAFMQSFVGKTLEAITLSSPKNSPFPTALNHRPPLSFRTAPDPNLPLSFRTGPKPGEESAVFTEALTDNYQNLQLRGRHPPNRWLTASIETVANGAFVGRLISTA